MEYIIGIIVALAGGLFYYKTKAKSAGALLENTKTKEQLAEASGKIEAHSGRIDSEAEGRQAVQRDMEENGKEVSNEELVKFINAINKSDKR